MLASDIKPGGFYLIKSPMITNGPTIYRVVARILAHDAAEFPWEITAANYKIKSEEVFPLTDRDLKLAELFKY